MFESWRRADKPFAYVGACIELAGAWARPADFVTHLPIGFDATCSGIQHLALIARDEVTGSLVNLINHDEPQDIYRVVITGVMTALETDDNEFAQWWLHRLKACEPKRKRKLLKTAIMTFAYSATEIGMSDKIIEVYYDLFQPNEAKEEHYKRTYYLAEKVMEACRNVLPGPARLMEHIRALAKHCAERGRFLEWLSPTGFPVSNRYQLKKTKRVPLIWYGDVYKPTIAVGALSKINELKVLNAAAPNFVHSLDAAHLIRIVLAAVSEGIIDVLTVHDSFACLAPQATRLNQIVRSELAKMYLCYDALGTLYLQNAADSNLPLPDYGKLDPFNVQQSEYPFI
jgi:DNA-directed RNA polymerase